jgi:hypothetical protein
MKLPKGVLVSPAKLARNRPKLAALIGDICGEWSHIDGLLATLFAKLLRDGSLLACETLDHVREVSAKRQILMALAKHMIKDADDRKILGDLLGNLQSLATTRTKYVHARWLVSDRWPDKLIWFRRLSPTWGNEVELVGENELTKFIKELEHVRLGLDSFIVVITAKIDQHKVSGKWPRQAKIKK